MVSINERIVNKALFKNKKGKDEEVDIFILFIDLLIDYIKKEYHKKTIDPFYF